MAGPTNRFTRRRIGIIVSILLIIAAPPAHTLDIRKFISLFGPLFFIPLVCVWLVSLRDRIDCTLSCTRTATKDNE